MKCDVSVGIVNYNDYDKTKQAIRSLLEYTHDVRASLYLVDNASRDKSAERLSGEFSELSVIFCDRNLGFGAGHNLLLPIIDSEFHVIMNPDVVITSDILSELTMFMRANPDVMMVTPKVVFPSGAPQHLPKRDPKLKYLIANRAPSRLFSRLRREYRMQDEDLSDITDIQFATGCFLFVRTEIFKKIGGFDERYFMYFEDADLSRTLRDYGKVVFFPFAKVQHDYARTSAKKMKYLLIHIGSMFQYFMKWNKRTHRQKKEEKK